MKSNLKLIILIFFAVGFTGFVNADEKIYQSRINSVKLFQNQAEIIRKVTVPLEKGSNNIVLGGLPDLLYDWSVKGSLPKEFNGKILSIEIEKKALVQKRQKKILEIEEKLDALREKDLALADDLKNIASQEKLLNSISDFTGQTIPREIATKVPKVSTWNETLNYIADKKSEIFASRRRIEKDREKLGKEIQKWEFELSQIAGYGYFSNYQALNNAVIQQRQGEVAQQYYSYTDKYAERARMLKNPTEKVDYEKRANMIVYSAGKAQAEFTISYVIPKTYWQMIYDIRASLENSSINMSVFGNIFQNSGEDWHDVDLALSTGTPVNSMTAPPLYPWIVDVYQKPDDGFLYSKAAEKKTAPSARKMKKELEGAAGATDLYESDSKEESVPSAQISEKGMYFSISMPLKQTIYSTAKYQKKFIQDFDIKDKASVKFFYEAVPQHAKDAYLKVKLGNTTGLPILPGEAQIFLENEYMGKIQIPYMPAGKSENLIIGNETRILSFKELLKKFEDTSGVFGGKRRITYNYKLTVENQLSKKIDVVLLDSIPVSNNKKVDVEILNVSLPFAEDKEFQTTHLYSQGLRKWDLSLEARQKKTITYDIVISFDKELTVQGIR